MEHQKNPKDINTNSNNQAENSAGSSSTNTTISEQEKAEVRATIRKEHSESYRKFLADEIPFEELEKDTLILNN